MKRFIISLLVSFSFIFMAVNAGRLSNIPLFDYNKSILERQPRCGDFDANGEGMVIDNLIRNKDVVFDVGANVGKWSKRVLSRVLPSLICAFEPIPKVYLECFNSLQGYPVIVKNLAISSVNDEMDFFSYPDHWNGVLSSLYQRELAEKSLNMQASVIKVKTRTIDSVCFKENIDHIDFLKIDTEGAEYDVLLGAVSMLSAKSIDIIQFEYGKTYKDSKKTLEQVLRLLTKFDYVVFKIYPGRLVHIKKWESFLEFYDQSNYLAVASDLVQDYSIVEW